MSTPTATSGTCRNGLHLVSRQWTISNLDYVFFANFREIIRFEKFPLDAAYGTVASAAIAPFMALLILGTDATIYAVTSVFAAVTGVNEQAHSVPSALDAITGTGENGLDQNYVRIFLCLVPSPLLITSGQCHIFLGN